MASVSIPLDRPGLGWLVAVLAGTAALVIAAANPSRPAAPNRPVAPNRPGTPGGPTSTGGQPSGSEQCPGQPVPPAGQAAAPLAGQSAATRSDVTGASDRGARWWVGRLFWAATTVALVGVGTVRAAGWLFVLCLLAAGMAASLTVTGGRSPLGLLLSAVLPPAGVVRSVPWAVRGLFRVRTGPIPIGRFLATAAVSIGLLVVFGVLFASADPRFADLLQHLLPEISVGTVFRWVFLTVTIGPALLGGAYLLTTPPDLDGLHLDRAKTVGRAEWAVPLTLLNLLFAAFVAVQLPVLFGGAKHVLGTDGPTFAEYARSGFWQLLIVSGLTLLVIAGVHRWAPRTTGGDRTLVRVLVGLLSVLSMVVVASALHRMQVYTDAYGATRLRLLVATMELWLGLVFLLVLGSMVRLRAGWLPQVALGAAVLALLGLAVANPDRVIAERNIDRYRQTGRIDIAYLADLSPDAAPALDRLTGQQRTCALRDIAAQLDDESWREFNLGRYTAEEILRARPVPRATPCPARG